MKYVKKLMFMLLLATMIGTVVPKQTSSTVIAAESEMTKQTTKKVRKQQAKAKRKKKLNKISKRDWQLLYRVVTAEAGYSSKKAQKNVAYVIFNRRYSKKFPNSIRKVIYQKGQFACIPNGMAKKVKVTKFTKKNVQEAWLNYKKGKSAKGALYFTHGRFGFNVKYLFTDDIGHNFYK